MVWIGSLAFIIAVLASPCPTLAIEMNYVLVPDIENHIVHVEVSATGVPKGKFLFRIRAEPANLTIKDSHDGFVRFALRKSIWSGGAEVTEIHIRYATEVESREVV